MHRLDEEVVRKMNICIVLTGTIVPNAIKKTYLDPMKRRKEYLDSIKYYTKFAKVYFLENSSYDLLGDKEFQGIENLTIIKHPKSDQFYKGSGYQEFQMIDDWIYKQKDISERFIKITGRYLFEDFEKIFFECCKENEFGLIAERIRRPIENCRTDIFYSTVKFYKENLSNSYSLADDMTGEFIERVIAKKLMYIDDVRLFKNYPIALGIEGSNAVEMKVTFRKTLKKIISKFLFCFNNRYRKWL